MSRQSTELTGMWQTSERTGIRERVRVGHHLGRLNAQARLTRLAVEQRWQHQAEQAERNARMWAPRHPPSARAWRMIAHSIRTRLAASQRARKVDGLAF